MNKTRISFYLVTLLFTCRHGLEITGQLSYRFYVAHLIPHQQQLLRKLEQRLSKKNPQLSLRKFSLLNQKHHIDKYNRL